MNECDVTRLLLFSLFFKSIVVLFKDFILELGTCYFATITGHSGEARLVYIFVYYKTSPNVVYKSTALCLLPKDYMGGRRLLVWTAEIRSV